MKARFRRKTLGTVLKKHSGHPLIGLHEQKPLPLARLTFRIHWLEGVTSQGIAGRRVAHRLSSLFTPGFGDIGKGVLQAGRPVFRVVCIACHEMHEVSFEQFHGNSLCGITEAA